MWCQNTLIMIILVKMGVSNLPLDKDQYNVRRYYRNGVLIVLEQKTTRNPKTGAIIGKTSTEKFKFKYAQASLTALDAKFMGEIVQRVKKKVEIPYNYEFDHSDHSKLSVKIDDVSYNIEQVEPTYNNRMFVYLSTVTGKREVSNA